MNKMLFDTEPETLKPPQLKNPSILQALVKSSSWCLSLAVGVLCQACTNSSHIRHQLDNLRVLLSL